MLLLGKHQFPLNFAIKLYLGPLCRRTYLYFSISDMLSIRHKSFISTVLRCMAIHLYFLAQTMMKPKTKIHVPCQNGRDPLATEHWEAGQNSVYLHLIRGWSSRINSFNLHLIKSLISNCPSFTKSGQYPLPCGLLQRLNKNVWNAFSKFPVNSSVNSSYIPSFYV